MKRKQATLTQTFYTSIKSIKSTKNTKRKQATFFFLDVFYAHKNAVFFALHTRKYKKAHKKYNNVNKRISDFLLLRCFLSA